MASRKENYLKWEKGLKVFFCYLIILITAKRLIHALTWECPLKDWVATSYFDEFVTFWAIFGLILKKLKINGRLKFQKSKK